MIIRSITFALMSKQSAFDYKILGVTFFPKAYLSSSTPQPLTKTILALLKRLVMSVLLHIYLDEKDAREEERHDKPNGFAESHR